MPSGDYEFNPSVTLIEGFPDHDRSQIALMFWAAFGPKLKFALSPQDKAIAMLEKALNPQASIVARTSDGRILGVAGYKTSSGSFIEITFNGLKLSFGIGGAIWRGIILSLLQRKLDADSLLMDGIFVAEDARGRGVGALLLSAIKQKAQEQGCTYVRLDVIDTNPRAQQLYQREGFHVTAIRRLGPLRYIFGFRHALTMKAEVIKKH